MRPFSHHRIAVAVTVLAAVAVAQQPPRPGNEYRLRLDSDQRADPGRQPARAGPERRRRAARDLEPRQLADVDLRDSALPGREGGRNLDGRDGVAGEQRPRPRRHARQDVEALRAGSRRRQHVHRSGDRGTLDVAERRLVGRRRRRVRVRDRGHRGEGRSAGDRVARNRGGGSPARIDPAGRLRGRDDRVVPRDGRGQRRDRALRGHERRPGRRLCSASSTQPRSSRRPAAPRQGMGERAQRPHRRRRASTLRTPTARPRASTATAAGREHSRRAPTRARRSAPGPGGGSGSPGATTRATSPSRGRTGRRAHSNRCSG